MHRILILFVVLSMSAWAALPPQSPQDLAERAELVVEAEVVSVRREKKMIAGGYDYHYTVTLAVKSVTKGDFQGQTLDIICKKTGERPSGWAGPQGQNVVPKEGDTGIFYLSNPPAGPPRLLEPNGWKRL